MILGGFLLLPVDTVDITSCYWNHLVRQIARLDETETIWIFSWPCVTAILSSFFFWLPWPSFFSQSVHQNQCRHCQLGGLCGAQCLHLKRAILLGRIWLPEPEFNN